MVVCRPWFLGNGVSGLEVLNPCAQVFVPAVFGEVEVQGAMVPFPFDHARRHDVAITLVLTHLCLDQPAEFVDGTQGKVEFSELVIATAVIRATDTIPSAVVPQLDTRHVGESTESIAAFKQAGLGTGEGNRDGIGSDKVFQDGLEFDGDENAVGKAFVGTFMLFNENGVKNARFHVIENYAAKVHNIAIGRHFLNQVLRNFLSTKLSTG